MFSAIVFQKKEFGAYLGEAPLTVDLNKYESVAMLDKRDLSLAKILVEAFDLTNSIDAYWGENEGVEVLGGGRYRSTSVGDVIWLESDDGVGDGMYIVDNFGFKRVNR